MTKELIGLFLILILVYLLVSNGSKTNQVITAIASGVTNITATLQGRGGSGFGQQASLPDLMTI